MSGQKRYTLFEMMVIAAAREIRDGETVFAGIGLPVLATAVAQKTHAPNACIIFESGGMKRGTPITLPVTVDDFGCFSGADAAQGMYASMAALGRGEIDVTFIGGAQVDKYGNVNSTVIGYIDKPETIKVILPGSGGACPMGCLGKRTIIIMPHEKRRLVEKLYHITTPGWLWGPGAREEVGLPPDRGPSCIITTMGILRFDPETKEAYLDAVYEGVSVEEVKANTGWDLKVAPELKVVPPPTDEELKALRETDPARIYYPPGQLPPGES